MEKLYDKCNEKYDAFVAKVDRAYREHAYEEFEGSLREFYHGDEFLSAFAYKYNIFGDIICALEEMDLSEERMNALLGINNPLSAIFDRYMKLEDDHMDYIRMAIEEAADREIEAAARKSVNELGIRPATESERNFAIWRADIVQSHSGFIGYLSFERGSADNFYTNWRDGEWGELNDSKFKNTFSNFMNTIKATLLRTNSDAGHYVGNYPSAWDERYSHYAFRVDVDNYTFLISMNPSSVHTIGRVYAYSKSMLDSYLEEISNREEIRFLEVIPGEQPLVNTCYNDLDTLQCLVGGPIECVYPWDGEVCIICNEEGKIRELTKNRPLRYKDGQIYDWICGWFMVVGIDGENFRSLTDEEIEKYSKILRLRGID